MTIGEVLGVYGLSFVRGVVFVDIEASGGWFLAPVPVQLFEVIDGTIPGGWVAKLHDDGALTLWPASFYTEYYHERLAHFDAEIVEDFLRVREELGFEPRS